MKKIIALGVLIAIFIGVTVSLNRNSIDDDLVIKISNRKFAGSFATLVAKDMNLFEKNGLKVEFETFSSGSESYNALVRGDIDYDPYLTLIPILLNDAKDPGKVKVSQTSSLTSEEKFDQILVKNNSNVTSLLDLKGKKVGVNPGSTAMTFLKIILKEKNIDPESVTYVQLQTQDQLTSLESGSIDALMSYEPTTAIALDKGEYRVIYGSVLAEAFPNSPLIVRAANGEFAKNNPNAVKRLDKVFREAQEYAKENSAYLHQLMSKELNLPLSASSKINLSYLGQIDENNLQNFIDFLYSNSELKQTVLAKNILFQD